MDGERAGIGKIANCGARSQLLALARCKQAKGLALPGSCALERLRRPLGRSGHANDSRCADNARL
jgi:hypothetical protein